MENSICDTQKKIVQCLFCVAALFSVVNVVEWNMPNAKGGKAQRLPNEGLWIAGNIRHQLKLMLCGIISHVLSQL